MHPSTRHRQVSATQVPSTASSPMVSWGSLLAHFSHGFTRPSFSIFWKLVSAWILCPGRHTITRLYLIAEPDGSRAHDAYHRFLRIGAWCMEELWRTLAVLLVEALCPERKLHLALDDTLFQKWGSKVEGAGRYKDPVRSKGSDVVFVTGLNFVSVAILIKPPWGGMPPLLPLCVQLYRKQGPSHIEMAATMITKVAGWFPEREFVLACDGAYSCLARAQLPRTVIVSRTRRNAELYEPQVPPRHPGQRSRPRQRGPRLASPVQMAQDPRLPWQLCKIEIRGRQVTRLVYARVVLWWYTCRSTPVLLVIVRDPTGRHDDEYLFTTDAEAVPEAVVSQCGARWAIEETHRHCKQFLGAEDPQCSRHRGPERAGSMSLFNYSLVWLWYLVVRGACPTWPQHTWYGGKAAPSFADALAEARRELWRDRISIDSERGSLPTKFQTALIETLAYAA